MPFEQQKEVCLVIDIRDIFPLLNFCTIGHYWKHTHTQPFNGLWSGTTRVGRYQKKHSPTHTHPDHRTSFIIFLHLQRSTLFILRAWQSCRTTSLQVLFGLPLGLGPSTSYSIYFFTQSSSSFRSTCPSCSKITTKIIWLQSVSMKITIHRWQSSGSQLQSTNAHSKSNYNAQLTSATVDSAIIICNKQTLQGDRAQTIACQWCGCAVVHHQ